MQQLKLAPGLKGECLSLCLYVLFWKFWCEEKESCLSMHRLKLVSGLKGGCLYLCFFVHWGIWHREEKSKIRWRFESRGTFGTGGVGVSHVSCESLLEWRCKMKWSARDKGLELTHAVYAMDDRNQDMQCTQMKDALLCGPRHACSSMYIWGPKVVP
eukprot:1161309-Pelagomonas_calceolata.AAC.3